jgi:putative addiction module component (TIGR02574 family)
VKKLCSNPKGASSPGPPLANLGNSRYSMVVKSLESIASEALLLPKDQRFTLAHRILSSVEPEAEPEVEAAWDAQIRERIRRYDAGQTAGLPGREVFAELDKKLGR